MALDSSMDTLSGGMINMGDLSYANGDEPLWDRYGKYVICENVTALTTALCGIISFGNLKQFAAANIPMMTTAGNHEWFDSSNYDFTAFLSRYDYPLAKGFTSKQLYYSFNVGLVHWVMVSGYCKEMKLTSTQPCLSADSAQLAVSIHRSLKETNRLSLDNSSVVEGRLGECG